MKLIYHQFHKIGKKKEIEDILHNKDIENVKKIHLLLGFKKNENKSWNPPYYGKDDIEKWIRHMQNMETNQKDTFKFIDTGKENKIFANDNSKNYFKTLLYGFIYGFNLRLPPFQHDIPKNFIKLVKKVFVEYKIESVKLEDNIKKDFIFLFYEENEAKKYIKQNKLRDNQLINFKEKLFIYEKNIKENKSNKDDSIDINNYFLQTIRKYNKSLKKLMELNDIVNSFDFENENSNISSLSEQNNNIPTSCLMQIESINNEKFKEFKADMKKVCKFYSNFDKETNMKDLELFLLKVRRHLLHIENKNIGKVTLNIETTKNKLCALFEEYMVRKMHYNIDILFYFIYKYNFEIKLYENGIETITQDAGGVTDSFFNDISHELFENKVFIEEKINDEKRRKYFLNPEFELGDIGINFDDEIYTDIYGYDVDEYDKMNLITSYFWIFVGSLCAFFLINGFKFPYEFSSFILSGFFKEHFSKNSYKLITKDSDFVYYMMKDFKNLSKTLIIDIPNYNLTDDELSEYEFTLNRYLTLTNRLNETMYIKDKSVYDENEKDPKITNENYINYIFDLSNNLQLNPIKDYDNEIDIYNIYINFFDGIHSKIRKGLKRFNISLDTLNDILLAPVDDVDVRKQFVENIIKNTEERVLLHNNQSVRNFFEKIKETLYDDLYKNFPDNEIKILRKFWTGIDYYDKDIEYVFNITRSIDDITSLPVSHTCSKTIDVPIYNNVDTFWKKLKQAVNESYSTFELQGGSKKKKSRNKRVLKSLKK